MNEAFMILSAGDVVIATIFAAMLIATRSRMAFLSPFMVCIAAWLSYATINEVVGRAHPASDILGWSKPLMGDNGAKVIGGKLTDDVAYLLIQEKGQPTPRYWSFAMDPEMRRAMKQAMDLHAKANGGNPWGFVMKEAKGKGKSASGEGTGPGGSGNDPSYGKKSPFQFEEPKTDPLPPKDS